MIDHHHHRADSINTWIHPIENDLYHLPGFYDPFSAVSHLLGALIFLALGIRLLLRVRRDTPAFVASAIYVFSGMTLLSMSGVFHMMASGGAARSVLQRLDHAAIFLLIAGTFTPIHTMLFTGWRRWVPLGVVWTCGITGITLKTIFFHGVPEWLGLTLYLALGWFGGFSAFLIARAYGAGAIKLLLFGAIAYTIGAMVELFDWPTLIPHVVRPHEVFHIAVMAGMYFHWIMIRQAAGLRAEAHSSRMLRQRR